MTPLWCHPTVLYIPVLPIVAVAGQAWERQKKSKASVRDPTTPHLHHYFMYSRRHMRAARDLLSASVSQSSSDNVSSRPNKFTDIHWYTYPFLVSSQGCSRCGRTEEGWFFEGRTSDHFSAFRTSLASSRANTLVAPITQASARCRRSLSSCRRSFGFRAALCQHPSTQLCFRHSLHCSPS